MPQSQTPGPSSGPAHSQGPAVPQPGVGRARRIGWLILALAVFALLFFGPGLVNQAQTEDISYSQLLTDVQQKKVDTVSVGTDGEITGTLTSGQQFATQAPPWALTTTDLASQLEAAGVKVSAHQQADTFRQLIVALLPTLLLIGAFIWIGRVSQRALANGAGGLGGMFRQKSRVTDAERPKTRFADVAGYEGVKREVREVVDYLQNPGRYRRAGAQGPKGVLLVGPPGTGKTLLARAVAGEASVPFYAVTGSSFVELFVGLGASRVRDLFAEARRNAPAIIFIDEIDAIGARRGVASIGGSDEREQTLNQMLAELDGFSANSSVVVLANTNRPEVLDPALLRPGRFDRQIQVPLPVLQDRERILAVHVRDKRIAPAVDLSVIARGTPGFSGADLANLVNEAALNAARDNRDEIRPSDFDAALDRLILGMREETSALLPQERDTVAVHEGGHALVAALSPTADPVSKITILPAGMSLGATHQLPENERRLYSEQYLHESLAVRLGGRAAELVVFGQASTGAASDLAGATELAVRMVREFGLSARLGPVAYPPPTATYLGTTTFDRPYAEATQRLVDTEVSRLLREAEEHATALIREHRGALDELARRLLEDETVDGEVVYDIVQRERAVKQLA